jgi:hypothetical protein
MGGYSPSLAAVTNGLRVVRRRPVVRALHAGERRGCHRTVHGYALTVTRLDPGRTIVLRQAPPEHPWNAVWTFVVEPRDATSCRLLSRSRAERPTVAPMRLANALLEPVITIMTRRMLLGIKQRAEAEAIDITPVDERG